MRVERLPILRLFFIILASLFLNSVIMHRVAGAEDVQVGDYHYLYLTGVSNNDSNKDGKLDKISKPGQSDPHWTFLGVKNISGAKSCQPVSGSVPATTVVERGDYGYQNSFAGLKTGIGANYPSSIDLVDEFVWSLKSDDARWISQNQNGLHYSSDECPDPSGIYDESHSNVRNSNSFLFKLKDKFTIDADKGIDVTTLGLRMNVQTDNLIKVKVNGKVLMSPDRGLGRDETSPCHEFDSFLRSSKGADFICPDFKDDNTVELRLNPSEASVFNLGSAGNSLEIEIFSTYSNVGFIITDIGVTGQKKTIVTDNSCRPITDYTIPKGTDYGVVTGTYPGQAPKSSGEQKIYYSLYDTYYDQIKKQTIVKEYKNESLVSSKKVNLTTIGTDGNRHSIEIRETRKHITSITATQSYMCDSTDLETGLCTGGHWYFTGWDIKTAGPASSATAPAPDSFICFDYKLSSSFSLLNVANKFRPEGGTSFGVSASISNSSFTKDSEPWKDFYLKYATSSHTKSTKWQISTLKKSKNTPLPSYTRPGGVGINEEPCRYYGFDSGCASSKITNMKVSETGLIIPVNGLYDVIQPQALFVPDEEAGTKYCFVFSIAPSTSESDNNSDTINNSGWTHSPFDPAKNCFIISKKPKTQVWGGDLFVGRSIDNVPARDSKAQSSTTVKSNKTYGSWVEYGILASSTISGTASGSAFNDGLISATVCKYGKLSFTNAGDKTSCSDSTPKGYYKTNRSIPNVANDFQLKSGVPKLSGEISLNSLDSNDSQAYTAGNITIKTQSVDVGKTVIIKSDGDVYINGDIIYGTVGYKYKKLSEIPQVIIIAKNIRISSSVSRIDSWLVATNLINTCWRGDGDSETSRITAYVCNNKLVVNGPVMANYLYLRRTAGSDAGLLSGNPAEVMNLRPDAYLWSYYKASSSGNIITVYNTEVPVRF